MYTLFFRALLPSISPALWSPPANPCSPLPQLGLDSLRCFLPISLHSLDRRGGLLYWVMTFICPPRGWYARPLLSSWRRRWVLSIPEEAFHKPSGGGCLPPPRPGHRICQLVHGCGLFIIGHGRETLCHFIIIKMNDIPELILQLRPVRSISCPCSLQNIPDSLIVR